MIKLLLENGATDPVDKNSGQTALYMVCRTRKVLLGNSDDNNDPDNKIAELILEKFPKETVNRPDKTGYTPLYWSIVYRLPTMVKLLLANGADIENQKVNIILEALITERQKDVETIAHFIELIGKLDNSRCTERFIAEHKEDSELLKKRAIAKPHNITKQKLEEQRQTTKDSYKRLIDCRIITKC